MVVLQFGTASSCCLLPQYCVCFHRTETRLRSGWVVVYLWSCFNEAICNCPFGYNRGIFCIYLYPVFFMHGFLDPEPTRARFFETNQTRARLIRTCDTCAHPYTCIYHIYSQYKQGLDKMRCNSGLSNSFSDRFFLLVLSRPRAKRRTGVFFIPHQKSSFPPSTSCSSSPPQLWSSGQTRSHLLAGHVRC